MLKNIVSFDWPATRATFWQVEQVLMKKSWKIMLLIIAPFVYEKIAMKLEFPLMVRLLILKLFPSKVPVKGRE